MINSDFCWISDGLSTQIRFNSGFTGPETRESRFSQIDSRGTVRNARTANKEIPENRSKFKPSISENFGFSSLIEMMTKFQKKIFRNNLIISDLTKRGPTNIEDHRPDKDQVNFGTKTKKILGSGQVWDRVGISDRAGVWDRARHWSGPTPCGPHDFWKSRTNLYRSISRPGGPWTPGLKNSISLFVLFVWIENRPDFRIT